MMQKDTYFSVDACMISYFLPLFEMSFLLKNIVIYFFRCIAFVKHLRYINLEIITGGFIMAKTANINLRIEPSTKAQAENYFLALE